jgi:hypothetical protein
MGYRIAPAQSIADCGNRIPESFHAGTLRTKRMSMGYHALTHTFERFSPDAGRI